MPEALADIAAVDLFKAIGPHLSDLWATDDTLVDLYLDLAGQHVSPNVFGTRYKSAVVYLALHLAALDSAAQANGAGGGAGGTVGPIIGERAGEVSRNYGFAAQSSSTGSGWQSDLDNTIYGKRFQSIRRLLPGGKLMSTQRRTWPVPGAVVTED